MSRVGMLRYVQTSCPHPSRAMQASDADGAGSSTREVELDCAAPDNRVLILRDLIARRQIRIEVIASCGGRNRRDRSILCLRKTHKPVFAACIDTDAC